MAADISTLCTYLDEYGWDYGQLDSSTSVLETGWAGEERNFTMAIEVGETWIRFDVVPLIDVSVHWQHFPDVLRYLMELNFSSHYVKLGLNPDERLTLSCQCPVLDFTYEGFCYIIGTIGYYADVLVGAILARLEVATATQARAATLT